jgi:hypothetical protein
MLQRSVVLGCICVLVAACGGDDQGGDTAAGSGGSSGSAATSGKGGSGTSAGKGGTTASAGKGGAGAAAASGTGAKGGAGASAGKGGAGASGNGAQAGTAGSAPVDMSASVLERNKHASRDGHFVQPALTKDAATKMARDTGFMANFSGSMWASPLYLEHGPSDKGVFFAVTTGNDVFAIDEETGAKVWTKNIGTPAMKNGVSCGSIHPLGILGTPVIDADARTIFVAGAVGDANTIQRHEVHALNVDTGDERDNWPFNVNTVMGSQQFMAPPQNQRSALSLVKGVVYVAYGGHVGDCGDYRGWVVGIDSKDPSKAGGWATLGIGEGIWASGGMASDGESIFAVTGNSTRGASMRAASDSEQIVRITGLGTFDRSDKNLFFPMSWKSMDSSDADFWASSPLYLHIPGASPENYVLAIAKDGHFYLVDSANFGGMSNGTSVPRVDFSVSSGSMSIRTTPAAYTTSSGVHVVFSTVSGAKCPGGNRDAAIMSVRIPAGSPPKPEVVWCAALGGGETAPIATTTDGQNEAVVWYMNQGVLTAVDGETGAALWNSGSDRCTGIQKWSSPIAVKGRILAGGDGHLCSWSVH